MTTTEALATFIRYRATGSTVIDPQGIHNDKDYICLWDGANPLPGWPPKGNVPIYGPFIVLHKDGVDLIITTSPVMYEKFVLATQVATKLKLSDRDDRVTVFRALLYGEGPQGDEQATPDLPPMNPKELQCPDTYAPTP